MSRIVFVEGNIIAYSGYNEAKNLVSLAGDELKEKAIEVIDSDLELYKSGQLCPYYTYVAKGGISSLGNNLGCIPSAQHVLDLYNSEIMKIEELFKLEVPDYLHSTHYRHLFIGVIGALELFITEIVTLLVMGDELYYHTFLKETDYKISLKDIELGGPILDKAIYKVIHNINAHQLKNIKKLFKNVFEVDIPNTTDLGRYIATRHDLVHRNGNTIEDRSLKYVDISSEKLQDLIRVSNKFVENLMIALEKPIKHWEEDLNI